MLPFVAFLSKLSRRRVPEIGCGSDIIGASNLHARGERMSNLSVRGVDPATLAELKANAGRKGVSVNALVLQLIDQGLGKAPARRTKRRHHDLDALVGAWSEAEAAEFEAAVAPLREIDTSLWP